MESLVMRASCTAAAAKELLNMARVWENCLQLSHGLLWQGREGV